MSSNIKGLSILDLAVVCKRLDEIQTEGIQDEQDEKFMNQFRATYENFRQKYVDESKIKQFLGDSFEVYIENLIKSYKDEVYIKSYN